jgi:type VI secretion system protein ImpJ
MRLLSRVVWSEGMYLGPHVFQCQSRYFEDSLYFATSTLYFQPYGFLGLAFDPDALRNGTVALVHARGLFPDGLPFHMPECDPPPAARPIADLFPPTREGLTVLLGVPVRSPGGANCAIDGEPPKTRFLAESRTFQDENTGADERAVRIGRKNIRLLVDTEPQDGLVTMPAARIVRDGSGHYAFDPDFVPPCLQIGASERVMMMVRQLIEILDQKSTMLAGPANEKATELSPRKISNFWLLHAVNSGLAALRHHWASKRGHPEELFLELSRLGGALCTFSLDSHPRTLPLYDHDRLGECFAALEQHIRTHLEIVVPTNCVTIPLTRTANYFWEGEVTDTRTLGRSRWIFGIHANAGEATVIARTPELVKVCSSKFVGELVKRAMPGLPLTHLPVPPPATPARVDSQYFAISKSGPFWDHIVKTRRIGIYVPGELPDPELELYVVLES